MAGQPVRPVLVAVLLFIAAVFLARLMLAGGTAWIVLAVALPFLILLLATRIRLVPALVVAALFGGAVVLFRWFLLETEIALAALLILPAVALGVIVAVKVVRRLRRPATPAPLGSTEDGEIGKEGEKE